MAKPAMELSSEYQVFGAGIVPEMPDELTELDAVDEDEDDVDDETEASTSRAGMLSADDAGCDAAEELRLIAAARQGDEPARERLVRLNYRMVTWTARRYKNSGVPQDDLVSEGMIGVLTAIGRFDAARGVRFDTYARWWVLDAMRNCVLRQSRVVRLPSNVVKEIGAMEREVKATQLSAGRKGVPVGSSRSVVDSVAKRLKRSGEHVERLMTLREPALSLDADDEATNQAGEGAADTGISPETITSVAQIRSQLYQLMEELDDRERIILKARYGLDTGVPATLEAVAEALGLTAERVRQIQREALTRVRKRFVDQGVLDGAAARG